MNMLARTPNAIEAAGRPRAITHSTRGRSHGPIVRLVSPSDVGELIKPFVFLDYFEADPAQAPAFGFHPHSGIATLTLLLNGQLWYEETTGVKGVIAPGGIEWMRAGGGVWHTGGAVGTERIKGYQLWVALPADLENGLPHSQYLGSDEFQSHGPARIILGRHGNAASKVAAPETMNYLDVRLKAGERWRYEPPRDHTVAWIAVHQGSVTTPVQVTKGDIAVFEESNSAIEFEAHGDAGFILGSAVKHPHDLVLGYYSVHTNSDALKRGEANIARIGRQLIAEGRLTPG
ncbi:MAG TPA: pirin family protein [Rhizomicrobium sp.]|nr:pirin family protein [Rhizomicrobium sp.]